MAHGGGILPDPATQGKAGALAGAAGRRSPETESPAEGREAVLAAAMDDIVAAILP